MTTTHFGHVKTPLKRIHIELTNICDFDCVFCPKSRMTRKPGLMDPDTAKELLSLVKDRNLAHKVTLHVMGEPTLHPQFFEILDHARDIDLPVGLTTNAGGLSGKVGQRLIDYELHQVDVSMQTPDEQSFQLRKAGKLTFESYRDGIMEFFGAYHRAHPDTVFKFRLLNTRFRPKAMERQTGSIRVMSNASELHQTFRYWASQVYDLTGTDQATKDKALARLGKLKSFKWNVVELLPNVFFETYMLADWGHAFDERPVIPAWAGYCFGMRDHFAILWNGDVTLCCIDFDAKTRMGNIHEKPLEEILSSPGLKRIIDGFRRFRVVHPYCRKCLGSSSRVSWLVKPVLGVSVLKVLKPYFYRRVRVY